MLAHIPMEIIFLRVPENRLWGRNQEMQVVRAHMHQCYGWPWLRFAMGMPNAGQVFVLDGPCFVAEKLWWMDQIGSKYLENFYAG